MIFKPRMGKHPSTNLQDPIKFQAPMFNEPGSLITAAEGPQSKGCRHAAKGPCCGPNTKLGHVTPAEQHICRNAGGGAGGGAGRPPLAGASAGRGWGGHPHSGGAHGEGEKNARNGGKIKFGFAFERPNNRWFNQGAGNG